MMERLWARTQVKANHQAQLGSETADVGVVCFIRCLKMADLKPTTFIVQMHAKTNSIVISGGIWGDSHIQTLDGNPYTFNGLGEYLDLDVNDG